MSAKQTERVVETDEIFHAPRVQPQLHAAAKAYLEEQGIVVTADDAAPKLLRAITESDAARRLDRVTREGYYHSLALGAASYLYIDSRPDRDELLDACAARLRIERKETTNCIALVLRCVINYGEQTQQHRMRHRQFWSRDAKMVGELIAKGAPPDHMITELAKNGLRSSQAGCIASMIGAKKDAKSPKTRTSDRPSLWIKQVEQKIGELNEGSLLILAIRKKNNSASAAKVCGSITLRHSGLVSSLAAWEQLKKASVDISKKRRFH